MTDEKRKELFLEEWNDLDRRTKIAIYNEYCSEHGDGDNVFEYFDEDFFKVFFDGENPMDVARAVYFGNIQSWEDEYIRFNAYGNLETFSVWDAEEEANNHTDEIYQYEDTWESYITIDDEDEEEEE